MSFSYWIIFAGYAISLILALVGTTFYRGKSKVEPSGVTLQIFTTFIFGIFYYNVFHDHLGALSVTIFGIWIARALSSIIQSATGYELTRGKLATSLFISALQLVLLSIFGASL